MEAYDLDQAVDSELANISTRGFIDTGDNVMIGGFIIGPDGFDDGTVLVRGIGPSLTAFGVPGRFAGSDARFARWVREHSDVQ